MDDTITDTPPPSRFFPEDLDNFAPPPPPIPRPFLAIPPSSPSPLRPSLLLVAISTASLHLLHHITDKSLVGTLLLPETPLSGNSLAPSPRDRSCSLYALAVDPDALLVAVQHAVAPERARAVAKTLLGGVRPERVVVLDSIRSQNFRGRMSADEALAFKLETSEQREADEPAAVGAVGYLPSGSVMDGLGAAILEECQMRKVKGTLLGTWPDSADAAALAAVGSAFRGLLPGLGLGFGSGLKVHTVDLDFLYA